MCGRFSQDLTLELLETRFELAGSETAELKVRYNLAPAQDAAVVLQEEGHRALRLLRWGLIPSWAKDPAIAHQLINARSETAREKPSFRDSFKKRRCLVPADGYYEWRRAGKERKPLRIVRPDRAPLSMAGLWDTWKAPDGKNVRTFTILTTGANEATRALHDRMPALLEPDAERRWLDPAAPAEELEALLKPYPGPLTLYPVSPAMNSPKHEGPDCVVPVAEPDPREGELPFG